MCRCSGTTQATLHPGFLDAGSLLGVSPASTMGQLGPTPAISLVQICVNFNRWIRPRKGIWIQLTLPKPSPGPPIRPHLLPIYAFPIPINPHPNPLPAQCLPAHQASVAPRCTRKGSKLDHQYLRSLHYCKAFNSSGYKSNARLKIG